MEKSFLLTVALFGTLLVSAQNVGIGTNTPTQKLDVAGAVKIGYGSSNIEAGTIRWNPTKQDFEGYNGERWISFSGGGSVWGNKEQYATENFGSSGTRSDTLFGEALSLWNNNLAVGASKAQNGIYLNAGVVQLYRISAASSYLYDYNTIYPPASTNNTFFGKSVALFDNALLVGEPGATANGNVQQGKAYVYRLDDENQETLQTTLEQVAADGDPFDGFGTTVGLASKDLAAVGAPKKNVGANSEQGRVYIFRRNYLFGQPLPNFTQEANLTPPDGNSNMLFGAAISFQPTCIAIGAPGGLNSGEEVGKVYIYRRVNNQWQYEATLNSPTVYPGSKFGASVSLSPNGDTCIVGRPQDGVVFIYRKNGANWTNGAGITAYAEGGFRGCSVQYRNGEILVGSKYAEIGITANQGKAQLYKHDGTGWRQIAVFTPRTGETNMLFGSNVQLGDGQIVVSAPGFITTTSKAERGRLYFYTK